MTVIRESLPPYRNGLRYLWSLFQRKLESRNILLNDYISLKHSLCTMQEINTAHILLKHITLQAHIDPRFRGDDGDTRKSLPSSAMAYATYARHSRESGNPEGHLKYTKRHNSTRSGLSYQPCYLCLAGNVLAWQKATARASAASSPKLASVRNSICNIRCTCHFSALPLPVNANLTQLVGYS